MSIIHLLCPERQSSGSSYVWPQWCSLTSYDLVKLPQKQKNKKENLTLTVSVWLSSIVTYCDLQLIIFISGQKWPPALDSLLLENGHHWKVLLILHHVKTALLCCLSPANKSVEVQLNCTCVRKLTHFSHAWKSRKTGDEVSPHNKL